MRALVLSIFVIAALGSSLKVGAETVETEAAVYNEPASTSNLVQEAAWFPISQEPWRICSGPAGMDTSNHIAEEIRRQRFCKEHGY